jgi:transposase
LLKCYNDQHEIQGRIKKGIEILRAENKQQKFLITNLQSQVQALNKHRFGSSSEKDKNQLPLFNEAEQVVDSKPKIKIRGKKKTGVRKPLPKTLERVEKVYDLGKDQKLCPNDGAELKHIGEVTNEQLKFIPASVKVIKHTCYKYACPKCNKHIVTATKPKDPIPKSIASPELLSYVSVSKYADGLPLYRLSQMFNRLDIKISRTNMAEWMIKCGTLIQPLINLMQDKLYQQPFINIDETTLQVLKEQGKKASTKSYMWVMRAANIILFNYDPSRGQKVAEKLLADYNQAIMADGYGGYDSIVAKNKLTPFMKTTNSNTNISGNYSGNTTYSGNSSRTQGTINGSANTQSTTYNTNLSKSTAEFNAKILDVQSGRVVWYADLIVKAGGSLFTTNKGDAKGVSKKIVKALIDDNRIDKK